MNQYTILRRKEPFSWEQIPALPVSNQLWGTETDITAQAQLCYDGEAIYVAMEATERHIRAEECGKLGMPCLDSCLEFFFCPMEGDGRYLNFEYNPNASLYLGMGSGTSDLIRLLPGANDLFRAAPARIPGGWEIVYQIPTAFIRRLFPDYMPVSGKTIRGNFYKCGDLTPQPHYLAWNRVDRERPNFHYPPSFGLLTFE